MEAAPKKKRIIVIGAGASGLGAARWLLDNDIYNQVEVLVLEARSRMGGRVYTSTEDAGNENMDALGLFDLGASWLHDPFPNNPISIMAESMGCRLQETDIEDDMVFDLQGNQYSDRETTLAYKKFENGVFTAAYKANKRRKSMLGISLERATKYELSPSVWCSPLMQLYASGLDFELGAPLYNCSSSECIDEHWLLDEMEGCESKESDPIFPVRGFGEIIEGLYSGAATDNSKMRPLESLVPSSLRTEEFKYIPRKPINCKLNTRVTSIEQCNSEGDVVCRVTTGTQYSDSKFDDQTEQKVQSWDADAVICTLPLGVLKSESVTFIPDLSVEKRSAISATGYGNVVKVILEFPKLFWHTDATFLGIADKKLCTDSSSRLSIFSMVYPSVSNEGGQKRGLLTQFLNGFKVCKKKILVSYGVGDAADMLDKMNDDELLSLCLSRVSCFARPGMEVCQPIKVVRTRWARDPYSLGAYSYWHKDNIPGTRADLGKREGKIWFAGEAVHESSMLSSSVCGAWISGVRVAENLCKDFGIPVLTPVF